MNMDQICARKHPPIATCRRIEINGLNVHLVDAGSGSYPVVLVHGGQAWAFTWRHQLEPLAAAGYRAIAPDLPGSGYSDLPRDYDYSIEGLSRFLSSLLDALQIGRAAFIASSAGGPPVLDFAIRHPKRVAALILDSTCGVPHSEPFLWRLVRLPLVGEATKFLLTPGLVRDNLRQMVHDKTLITDDIVTGYYEPLHRPGAWQAQLKLERRWQPGWVEANLERITAPTLVVWGKDDPVHPLKMAHEFGRRIQRAQVEILPACGHLPHEECPERFNQLLHTFLLEHLR